MLPSARRACCPWRMGVNGGLAGLVWADTDTDVNPTIAAAVRSPIRRAAMDSSCVESLSLRRHREVHVLGQDLGVQFIRDLDLEPVRPLGETLERDALPGLDAAVPRRIETGAHRVGAERLRLGAVETLLGAGVLPIERVSRLEVE